MLIYHPAFDANHCAFRLIALGLKLQRMDVDKARILDFFLSFPTAILNMRLPLGASGLRGRVKAFSNPYRDPVSPNRTFADMWQVQMAGLGALSASGYFVADEIKRGFVIRTDKNLPGDLEQRAIKFLEEDAGLAAGIIDMLGPLQTFGVNGLKERSGLLEYRYDPA